MDYLLFLFVCNLFPLTFSVFVAVLSCFSSASLNWCFDIFNWYILIFLRTTFNPNVVCNWISYYFTFSIFPRFIFI